LLARGRGCDVSALTSLTECCSACRSMCRDRAGLLLAERHLPPTAAGDPSSPARTADSVVVPSRLPMKSALCHCVELLVGFLHTGAHGLARRRRGRSSLGARQQWSSTGDGGGANRNRVEVGGDPVDGDVLPAVGARCYGVALPSLLGGCCIIKTPMLRLYNFLATIVLLFC
jgi:hypothetical protein